MWYDTPKKIFINKKNKGKKIKNIWIWKMLITSDLTMTFLLRTLRDWFDKLEAMALQNPALLQNKTEWSYVILFTDKLNQVKSLVLQRYWIAYMKSHFFLFVGK